MCAHSVLCAQSCAEPWGREIELCGFTPAPLLEALMVRSDRRRPPFRETDPTTSEHLGNVGYMLAHS